ncbi:MAG: phosphatidate cytidylyltransferase [Opitutaceae bacterium]|nr:phosphatidate cytidylyltransferase [Opitutaceae bacterium]
MLSRIISTLALWSIVLSSLWYFGAHAAVVLLTLLSALTLHEFYGLTEKMGARPFRWMGILVSGLITAGPYYLTFFLQENYETANLASGLLVLALLVACVRVLRERDADVRVETIAATIGGLLYIPFMLQFLTGILMRDSDSSANLTLCLWVIAVAKFCDVGALLTGLAIGRHKLAPNISPKKTWEGAFGGVLIAAGIGAAIAFFAADLLPESFTPTLAAILAVPLAIVAIISDLIESVIKRRADAKDTGELIPGIGGAFDLTDSLILTAPVAYFILLFVE